MNIFLAILSVALISLLCCVTLRFSVPGFKDGEQRKFFYGFLIAVCVLGCGLSIGAAFIPNIAEGKISGGVAVVEEALYKYYPSCKDRPLDGESLKEITSSPRLVREALNADPGMGLIASAVGANRIIEALEILADNVDNYKAEFDSEGEDFTLHNILDFSARKTKFLVQKVINVLHVLLVVIFGLLCGGVALAAASEKRTRKVS